MIGWVRDLSDDEYVCDHVDRVVVITDRLFNLIDAYEMSMPTAPSAGRVYRRTIRHDVKADDAVVSLDLPQHYVFFVENAPDDDPRGGQLHYPYQALII